MKCALWIRCSFLLFLVGCGSTRVPNYQAPAAQTDAGRLAGATVLSESERSTHLAAFDRVWETVRDRHWDPNLGGVNWQEVYNELRPKIKLAKSREGVHGILNDMLRRLKLSHYAIIPTVILNDNAVLDLIRPGVTGVDVRVVKGEAIVSRVRPGSAAHKANIHPGDRILSIEGKSITPGIQKVARHYAGKSIAGLVLSRAVSDRIRGTAGKVRVLEIANLKGEKRSVSLTLEPPPGSPFAFGHFPTIWVEYESKVIGDIGYIRLTAFADPMRVMKNFVADIERFQTMKGVILDLRGNPGGIGFMAMGLGGYFVQAEDKSLGTMITRDAKLKFVISPQADPFTGHLAILIDELSASTAEIMAKGLQDMGRAKLFGVKTAGAALPSLVEELPNGDSFQFAVANYISADGTIIEGKGVIPDHILPYDRKEMRAIGDPPLHAAINWIHSKK